MAFRHHPDIDRHAEIGVGRADKAARDGDGLADVARDGDADQVGAVDGAVGRIIGDPAGARHVNVGPGVRGSGADRGPGATVDGGIVEIARHHPGSETQAAGRLDQQDGEIATRSQAAIERLDRGLRAFGLPALIGDPGRDAAVEVGQQRRRVGRIAAHEAARPRSQPVVRIRILTLEQPAEIDAIVRRIDERVAHRVGGDLERRTLDHEGLDLEIALDAQFGRGLGKRSDRNRIAEHVIDPAHRRGRRDFQAGLDEPKVVTVARPQHEPMIAEPDRAAVTIDGRMTDIENGHARELRAGKPAGSKTGSATSAPSAWSRALPSGRSDAPIERIAGALVQMAYLVTFVSVLGHLEIGADQKLR